MSRMGWFAGALLIYIAVLAAGCLREDTGFDQESREASLSIRGNQSAPANQSNVGLGPETWMDIPLTDIATNSTFRISEFAGKKVLVESFALWCPNCLSEQRHLQKLKAELGDEIVIVSLDTDVNEGGDRVRAHLEKWGFDWRFAVSPKELTDALIEEFGLEVLDAKRAPVVLVCEDQSSSRLMKMGVKPMSELRAEVEVGCDLG